MAHITFVYPDFESLGVEYLMSSCAAAEHDVHFVFYEAEDTYLGISKREIDFSAIADEIIATKPDIVAFSCVTDNFRYQLQCARMLKKMQKGIQTIFGGIHPTSVPEKTLQNPCVDSVAIGEAEVSLVEFINACSGNGGFTLPDHPIQGILFKRNGDVVGNKVEGPLPDLNELPFPDKKPFFAALRDSLHEYRIITSRGCPYQCSYCFNAYIHQMRGKKIIRRRSISNVIAELIRAKNSFAMKYIIFVDDSFTTDKNWIREFGKRYKEEIGLPFACVANPEYINEEVAEILAYAGCINVQIGIQTLSEKLSEEVLDRKNDNEKIKRAILSLKRHHIMVQADHILGIPGDTIENQEQCVGFYNKYRPNLISIFWLTYYPKTTILDTALQAGIIDRSDIDSIESGQALTNESYLTGGSLKNPGPFYSISFILNWLPILPGFLVESLVRSRLYRLFRIKNYFLSTALPRVIQSIFNKRDFRGRSHIIRFVDKVFLKNPLIRRVYGSRKDQ